MVFPVVGGDGKPTGYDIDNSLRFNDGDSAQLSREFSADPDTRKKFTISFWVKRGELGSDNAVFGARTTANFWSRLHFDSSDRIRLQNVASGSTDIEFEASHKLRDPSAWYHIVFAVDTTQSAISDGVKLYINGTRITDTSSTNYSQNATFEFARNGTTNYIGRDDENSSFFDGYISEFYYVDNQQLAPTSFGETNDNGVWIPIDAKDDITFGANGFYLEFKQTGTSQNSSGIGADTSGNDEHFAVANLAAIDVTTDTPTNNFCTWNPLDAASNISGRFSEGNMDVDVPGNNVVSGAEANGCLSTIQFSKGKWYFEMKYEYGANGFQDTAGIGLIRTDTGFSIRGSTDTRNFSDNVFYYVDGPKTIDGTHTSYGDAWTQNDIIGVAANLDDDEVYFYKNGTIQNSGTAISKTFGDGFYSIANFHGSSNGGALFRLNTGNPSFSISSGNSDANGYGNFEYSVPSGYYAICTKNLAQYG